MAKSFENCVNEAVRGGMITEQEGKDVLATYKAIRNLGGDDTKAKVGVAKQLEMEAQERQRRALKSAAAVKTLQDEITSFTNASGKADLPMGWKMLHDRRGDEGKFAASQDGQFGLSVKELEESILSSVMQDLEAASHEFRRGLFSGDLKRTSKLVAKILPDAARTQARMSEVVKVMRGEKTDDVMAQQLAEVMMNVAEKLRLRFNEAGGSIGKLENWGGPQSHSQDAVMRVGRGQWIEFILPLLDRNKMVHSLTRRKLTDAELKESLEVVWERIVTDGFVDQEKISGVPVGRGALWSQHADHRFLHFKSAEAWQTYAKQFGNTDPWVSFMNWAQVMARDIAAMEKFGPNPTVTREYMKQWIKAKSSMVNPTARIIEEQSARLQELVAQIAGPNPEYVRLVDRESAIHRELAKLHASRDNMIATVTEAQGKPQGPRGKAYKDAYDALITELMDVHKQLHEIRRKNQETVGDAAAEVEFRQLLEDKRVSVSFADTANPTGYANRVLQATDSIWEFERGALNAPIDSKTANVMSTARNTITSTALHSAILSAITDTAFQTVRRGFLGMSASSANPVTVLKQTLQAIGTENRRYAVRSGLVHDASLHAWQRAAAYDTRWAKARSTTSYVADRVMSLQGLNAWTQGGKHAFGMELMGHLADESGKAWDDIDPGIRGALERAGFDAKGWDVIRRAKLDEPKPGAVFLRPNEIRDVNPELAQRYIAMILRETHYAIIEATPTGKALMLGGTRPGTVAGELVRGAGQLKTFPITVMMMQMGQTASLLKGGDRAGAARYVAAMLITGTAMGALAMALKDINAGRDPRKWLDEDTYLDPNFWGAALLQSGGLGLYGDFLFSQTNRFGGGWAKSLAGPLVDRAETVANLTFGNAKDVLENLIRSAKGEPTKSTRFGAELTKFLRQNFPTVVWNKLLMERMVWDQVQTLLDPEHKQAFQRQRLNRQRDFKQDFFWAPGEALPSRAPDLTRSFATK